jgi:glycosyltransferase involved in cell wall biosynthesis
MAMEGEAATVVAASRSGISVPSEDPAALAEAVLKLTRATAEDLARMGANGRAYVVAKFSQQDLLDRLEAALTAIG